MATPEEAVAIRAAAANAVMHGVKNANTFYVQTLSTMGTGRFFDELEKRIRPEIEEKYAAAAKQMESLVEALQASANDLRRVLAVTAGHLAAIETMNNGENWNSLGIREKQDRSATAVLNACNAFGEPGPAQATMRVLDAANEAKAEWTANLALRLARGESKAEATEAAYEDVAASGQLTPIVQAKTQEETA